LETLCDAVVEVLSQFPRHQPICVLIDGLSYYYREDLLDQLEHVLGLFKQLFADSQAGELPPIKMVVTNLDNSRETVENILPQCMKDPNNFIGPGDFCRWMWDRMGAVIARYLNRV
jgi:hypothetical protein